MFRIAKNVNVSIINSVNWYSRCFSNIPQLHVSEEVRNALESNKPVIALESTIITHGMPFPQNVECAKEVENIVREQGATPATIAIINGQIKVGLTEFEIATLGDTSVSKPIKTSRRDFSYVISHKLNGGTTVSGTVLVANKVGIPIFATGGIGGVHREVNETFDVSADLIELGKSNIAVVSSGVKSILDIPKTLEYLETHGVFVATFGDSKDFPAFYTTKSSYKAPYNVTSSLEAAKLIKANKDLQIESAMLFAVPVPQEYSLEPEIIDEAIDEALYLAKNKFNISGKEITPFILSQVAKITEGKSLKTNIALIKNNAKISALIASELGRLEDETVGTSSSRPVIIGGSNLDTNVILDITDIKLQDST